jgi:CIC family chloride channel protein
VWRWSLLFLGIGLIAGVGAVAFDWLTQLGLRLFLDGIAGYRPPPAPGEQHLFTPSAAPFNRWILLLLPALGGILSGWLVFTFAPEAEGHGTDAAIYAYHHKGGFIRSRVPLIKMVASAITLTTGGPGGREGPIAQIGAGFGSFLATRLHLSTRERHLAATPSWLGAAPTGLTGHSSQIVAPLQYPPHASAVVAELTAPPLFLRY